MCSHPWPHLPQTQGSHILLLPGVVTWGTIGPFILTSTCQSVCDLRLDRGGRADRILQGYLAGTHDGVGAWGDLGERGCGSSTTEFLGSLQVRRRALYPQPRPGAEKDLYWGGGGCALPTDSAEGGTMVKDSPSGSFTPIIWSCWKPPDAAWPWESGEASIWT